MGEKLLKCFRCSKEFYRSIGDYNQTIKRNTKKTYCSLQCNNQFDIYSSFRYFLRSARGHLKQNKLKNLNLECTLKVEDLKEQWDNQKGLCVYSGQPMDLIPFKNTFHPLRASLDRIDSSKGYIPGNIQFICLIANLAKNQFHENELYSFCEAVVNNKKNYQQESFPLAF